MQAMTEFLSGSSPYVYFFIFIGKLVEVALASLRSQLIIKGQRFPGAIAALFEYAFWLCITASVLTDFAGNPLKILVLVFAFSIGNVVGSFIEDQMALGFCSLTAIFMEKDVALSAAASLRENGLSLTLLPAEGIQGAERTAIVTTAMRRDVGMIEDLLLTADPNAIVTVHAAQKVKGTTGRWHPIQRSRVFPGVARQSK